MALWENALGFLCAGNDAGETIATDVKQDPMARGRIVAVGQVGPPISFAVYRPARKINDGLPGLVRLAREDFGNFERGHG